MTKAEKYLHENGIDPADVVGTGKNGNILMKDAKAAVEAAGATIEFQPPPLPAVALARRFSAKWGVPAVVLLALSFLKTGYGARVKARDNHFNLKGTGHRSTPEGYRVYNRARDSYDRACQVIVRENKIGFTGDYIPKLAKAWDVNVADLSSAIDNLTHILEK